MNSRAGVTRLPRRAGQGGGFSLVELLLAVALIGLLLGAVAFNFSTFQRGTRLEEGANQLEALLRYARAHAAATGHRVRISFEEDLGDGFFVPLGNLAVTWEPDPLAQPDLFQPLTEATPYLSSILDAISVEDVRPLTQPNPEHAGATSLAANDPGANDSAAAAANAALAMTDDSANFGFVPITFFPDGSSDSAEITIATRDDDGEDARRMVIRLVGLTGVIRRRVVVPDALAVDPPSPTASAADPATTGKGPP